MADPEDTRVIAKSNTEYLSEMKETWRVYAWVWRELVNDEARTWSKKMLFWMAVSFALFSAEPFLIGWLIDAFVAHDGQTIVMVLSALYVLGMIMKGTDHMTNTCREYVLGINWGQLKNRTTELFLEKSMGQHLREGDVLSVPNMDKGQQKAESVLITLLFEGTGFMLMLTMSYVFLFFLSFGAWCLVTVLLVIHVMWSLFLNRKVIEVCMPIDSEVRKYNRHRMGNVWERVERVKTSGKEEEESQFLWDWFGRILKPDRAFWLWYNKSNDTRAVVAKNIYFVAICYGAWQVWQGHHEVGFLVPLVHWTGRVIFTTDVLSRVEHHLNWNMPAVRSMMDALTLEPDVVDASDAVDLPAGEPVTLEIKGLSHTYVDRSGKRPPGPVFRNVNMLIEPGDKVALIGVSGSGKTSITRVVQRYFDPDEGVVLINGIDLRQIRQASWKRLVGCISQEAHIFDGTIRSNLLYALDPEERARTTDEELWALMRTLEIDFGDRLTDGLDTAVGKNGIKLSGGQKQRLAIGAVIIKRPPFLIMDETTSSLDATTEKAVQVGIDKFLTSDTTALIITHRLSTVRDICNKFYLLEPVENLVNGDPQIRAFGSSFEELAQRSATFERMAKDQGVVLRA